MKFVRVLMPLPLCALTFSAIYAFDSLCLLSLAFRYVALSFFPVLHPFSWEREIVA